MGLIGLVCAHLGASRVVLTDLPHVVADLQQSLQHAHESSRTGVLCVEPLTWGDKTQIVDIVAREGPFDLIICCEVVYQHTEAVLEDLLKTIQLLSEGNGTQVLVAYQQGRDGADIADTPFWSGLRKAGLELELSHSLSKWDDVWDDMDARWFYTYRRQGSQCAASLFRSW